jgi:transcriptional/translational regulatory protein YebC/TACO1
LVPKTFQILEGKEAQSALMLLDSLEDNDDINKLYSNFDVDEETLLQD